MMERKTWEEFRANGLLWWINMILHTFGWVICVEFDENDKDKIVNAYPARTKFRGFDNKANEEGYITVTKYLQENVDQLLEEAKE